MTQAVNLASQGSYANTTGILQYTGGGTGLTSAGASGNVLTSNGTTWISSTPSVTTGKSLAFSLIFGGQ